jgi:hypothetical protein
MHDMLLRRLSQSLKEQNWTAICIEFVLLVAGVFLGIQVSNWNAERVQHMRAMELFERLADDLESEKNNVDYLRDYYETTAAYAKVALQGFEAPESVDSETFVISAYQASQWQEAISSRSTFEEIIATGAIDLVHNEKARELLIAYYEYDFTKGLSVMTRPHYRELMRGVMPYGVQEAIKAACGDRPVRVGRTVLYALPKRCDIDIPAKDIERAAAIMRATPGFEQALRYQLAENDTKSGAYANTAMQVEPLIAALEGGVQ